MLNDTSLESKAGYANMATTSDVPRVSQETTGIQNLLAQHREIANMMEQRLHAVLRSSGPSGNDDSKNPVNVTSPLVNDLSEFRRQLEALASHYNDILNRLEV